MYGTEYIDFLNGFRSKTRGLKRFRARKVKPDTYKTEVARQFCIANPSNINSMINNNHTQDNFDPIGGGIGYRRIITKGKYNVSTKSQLENALNIAQSGEIVFVTKDSVIDLTGDHFTVPAGVTLASNRGDGSSQGALIFSDSFFPDSSDAGQDGKEMLAAGGENVRVTGLRLKGSYGYHLPHVDSDDRVSCTLRTNYGYMEVDNCNLTHGNKWAIDLVKGHGHHIHHNFFTFNRRGGYGYGVWNRGNQPGRVPPDGDLISIEECNLFMEQRHNLSAAGQVDMSYIGRYNVVIEHSATNLQFDNHGGGWAVELYNNMSLSPKNFWFGGMDDPPLNRLEIYNNYAEHTDPDLFVHPQEQGFATRYENNTLKGWRSNLPNGDITANKTELGINEEVTFTSNAVDPHGLDINCWYWFYNDGLDIKMTRTNQFSRRWTDPGIYDIRCVARNSVGLTSPIRAISVWVS